MPQAILFQNAHVVNDGTVKVQDVLISGEKIVAVGARLVEQGADAELQAQAQAAEVKDCTGFWLMPGALTTRFTFASQDLPIRLKSQQKVPPLLPGASRHSWKCPTRCRSR